MAPTVTVLTQIPSPYQVELFDALAASGRVRLRVIYICRQHVSRLWGASSLSHEHVVCEDGLAAASAARDWVDGADLVVFSWYSSWLGYKLIRRRAATGRPWCLWGERPRSNWGFLGRLRRRLCLAPLARTQAPIWGMGGWAVEAWRREFGTDRRYENVPYFSDLSRFTFATRQPRTAARTVLFSGSLTARKGDDLLAEAFVQVATDHPNLRLDLLGAGELEPALKARLAPVRDRVRFLGFRQWAELPAFYRTADVLCAPSRYDGWGMIVPEGLAAGLPVIATDRMGAAIDLVLPGVNGWLVRASSLLDLKRTLREVAGISDKKLDAMSSAATATVATHTLQDGVRRLSEAIASAIS